MRRARNIWWRTAAAAGCGVALTAAVASAGAMAPAKATVKNASAQVSGNWAGYVDSQSGVTSVAGEWVVPNAGSLPPGVSSAWVGIGGATTTDLIQAGTQQASSPFDAFLAGGAYAAWYELLPANPVFFTGCTGDPSCTVRPGDTMKVTISESAVGSNVFTIQVSASGADNWSYGISLPYKSSNSSGEWIFESPSLAGLLPVPVGNSGKVTFSGSNGIGFNGSSGFDPISSGGQPVIALPVETSVSALGADGNSFNVCTYTLSCPAP